MTPAQRADLEGIIHKLWQIETTLAIVSGNDDSQRSPTYRLMATLLNEVTDELDAVATPSAYAHAARGGMA